MDAVKVDLLQYLTIGEQGENVSMAIPIDITDWVEQYGIYGQPDPPDEEDAQDHGTFYHILFKPYNADYASPVVTSVEQVDGRWILTWTPTISATVTAGTGYTEVRGINADTGLVVKSRVVPTLVDRSVTGVDGGTIPEPMDDWLNRLLAAADRAEAAQDAAEDAQDAAEAAQDAAETAQGKAEDAQTAAETAQGKAEDAQTAAETAQGKAEDAQTAAEAAQTAAETAQGKAEDAQEAAETAQGKAETAQGKAEDAQDAAEDANTAAQSAKGTAVSAKDTAVAAMNAAETAMTHYPRVDAASNHWLVWSPTTNQWVDTGVAATGPKGEQGIQGAQGAAGADGGSSVVVSLVSGTFALRVGLDDHLYVDYLDDEDPPNLSINSAGHLIWTVSEEEEEET